jgi:hypothetical protein
VTTADTTTGRAVDAIRAADPWNLLVGEHRALAIAFSTGLEILGSIVTAFGPLVERSLAPAGWDEVQILAEPLAVNAAIADGWELIAVAPHVNAAPEYHLGRRREAMTACERRSTREAVR